MTAIDSGASGMATGAHRPGWGREEACDLVEFRPSFSAFRYHCCASSYLPAWIRIPVRARLRRPLPPEPSQRTKRVAGALPSPSGSTPCPSRTTLRASAEPHLRSLNDAWPICSQHSAAVTCSAIAQRPSPIRPYAVARPIGARRRARCHSRIGLRRRRGGAALCAADAVLCAARQAHGSRRAPREESARGGGGGGWLAAGRAVFAWSIATEWNEPIAASYLPRR